MEISQGQKIFMDKISFIYGRGGCCFDVSATINFPIAGQKDRRTIVEFKEINVVSGTYLEAVFPNPIYNGPDILAFCAYERNNGITPETVQARLDGFVEEFVRRHRAGENLRPRWA